MDSATPTVKVESSGPVIMALPAKLVQVDNDRFLAIFSETGRTECASFLEISVYKELTSPCTGGELKNRRLRADWDPEALHQLPDILKIMINKGFIAPLDKWLEGYRTFASETPLDITYLT